MEIDDIRQLLSERANLPARCDDADRYTESDSHSLPMAQLLILEEKPNGIYFKDGSFVSHRYIRKFSQH